MEDGPESAEGNYAYRDRIYRLVEAESEIWSVFDAEIYLGRVVAKDSPDGPVYTIDLAGEEDEVSEPFTDDWRRALEVLIDQAPRDMPA